MIKSLSHNLNNYTLYLSIFILLFSCSRQNKSVSKSSKANNVIIDSKISSEGNIFDVIEIVDFFQLKDTSNIESVTFKNIKKALLIDSIFYLKGDSDLLYSFSSEGNYIRTLHSQGTGPTEYREIKDFNINENTDEVYIYDFQKQKFLIYDLKFNFIRTEKIGFNFFSFDFINDNIVIYTAKHRNKINDSIYDYDLIILNKESKIIQKSIPFDSEKFSLFRFHKEDPFYRIDNRLYFNDIVSDTIYSIDNTINVESIFSYRNKTLSKEELTLGHDDLLELFQSQGEIYFNNRDVMANLIAINEKYIISNFYGEGADITTIQSIKNRGIKNYTFPNDITDLDTKGILKPKIAENSNLYSFIYPYSLQFLRDQYLEKYKVKNEIVEKMDKIINNSFEDGNQIVLKYKLLDF